MSPQRGKHRQEPDGGKKERIQRIAGNLLRFGKDGEGRGAEEHSDIVTQSQNGMRQKRQKSKKRQSAERPAGSE